jgi:uncharacterized protein YcfJ
MNKSSAVVKILAAAVAGLGLTGAATAATAASDVAQVISSTPIYERVATPQRECWNEQVTAYEERRTVRPGREVYQESHTSGGGALLGAIVGGAIGRQFGNSTGGRDRGTAAGAIIGGLIGNDVERNSGPGYVRTSRDVVEVDRVPVSRDVQRCRTNTEYRNEIVGYDVRYNYNGREYTTRLNYDPGPTLAVDVAVRPRGASAPNYREPMPTYRRTY